MKKYFFLILILLIIGGISASLIYFNQQRREGEAQMILEQAESALNAGDFDQAVTYLRDVVDRTRDRNLRNQVGLSLAHIGYRQESISQIQESLDHIQSGTPHYYEALFLQGRLHLEAEELSEAKAIFEEVRENTQTEPHGKFGIASVKYHQGDYKEAQPIFEEVLENYPDEEFIEDLKFKLGEVNYELFMAGHPSEIFTIHELQQGELLYHVARRYGVTPELIMTLNDIPTPERISPGRRLLIPEIEFSIIVDKSANTLELQADGDFFQIYQVSTGRDAWRTPSGEFEILEKLENPVWNDPQTGRTIPGGDPANELGTRWMPFYGKSIGIHGTIYPDRIGQPASNGCVSMYMEDVEELYDLVPVGTPVKVID